MEDLIVRTILEQGHEISGRTVARMLRAMGYGLRANRKTTEGRQHPDRDAQFNHINRRARAFQRRGDPVVSVDTKKNKSFILSRVLSAPTLLLGLLFAFLAVTVAAGPSWQTALGDVEGSDSGTLVEIPDAALREALEQALNKGPDEPITRGEMESLRSLYAGNVRQLTGVEYALNLQVLFVSDGAISNLAPLAGLVSLTELHVSANEVSDLAPLAGLVSLTALYLDVNRVDDLAPLAGLVSLTRLDVGENEVSDLAPLAGLVSLTALNLDVNRVDDLAPLAGLVSLTELQVSANEVSDLAPLAGLASLTALGLQFNDVSDLAPLADLVSLTELYVAANEVSDLAPLAGLVSLTELDVSANEVSDLAPLAGLVSLTALHLDVNRVDDLAVLAGLTSLEGLSLPQNNISDLAPLAGLNRLTRLYLGFNPIFDFTPISTITSLTLLHLDGTGMSDVDLAALLDLASLTQLALDSNRISDVSPLLRNGGIDDGDRVFLERNRLSLKSIETDIPALLQRGVEVSFDAPPALPDGAELAEIADPALRGAVETELRKGVGWPVTVDEFSKLRYLDVSNRGAEDLTGLELATSLRYLDLGGSDIEDIGVLTSLPLGWLSLRDTGIEDVALLTDMDDLTFLALDGNSISDLPTLPDGLRSLHLTDNSISDITALANIYRLRELRVSGNSITSLSPLAGMQFLRYLHANDNQVTDIAPLNFESLAELHLSNNAVQDISPLLNGEKLLMVDVRGNPLSGEAMSVLEALRERRVTVLAGETVPYFPAAGAGRQGFVRIVNRSEAGGEVFIEAVDDAGVRVGPVRLQVGARRAVHFNSADLENGNAAKGFGGGIGRPTAGDWRLEVISSLDIEVLSYIRTGDGFVTAMHDIAPDAMLQFFNPGSNQRQRSTLRVVNTEAEPAKWVTGGYDDNGKWHPMAGSIKVRPQHALTLTAPALENAHGLGDGAGKWRLRVRGFPWLAMSLLESPTGHLTNLSTVPNNAESLADGGWRHRVPLFLAAGGTRAGFLRVVNRSNVSGEVAIEAVDDEGNRAGPVSLELGSRQTVHFNSDDLEAGNNAKGLAGGIGTGEGDWRLALTSELDLRVLSYIRTADGFLTSMHDLAPRAEDGSHRVVFFNPGSNTRQVSKLRLINNGDVAARAIIAGVDDGGSNSGAVSVAVPAASVRTFTAAELEAGSERLSGRLGDGGGKWRLRVTADAPLAVMSLLETPTGHLANVSTGTAD